MARAVYYSTNMTEDPNRINQLIGKLEQLSKQQELFSKEIYALRNELYQLKASGKPVPDKEKETTTSVQSGIPPVKEEEIIPANRIVAPQLPKQSVQAAPRPAKPPVKTNLEKFIGENLISKIGIGITVIGVGIGAKYSIEHDLISPLTRIILGYLMGLGLLLFGMWLKPKYEKYSAVLVSGAMAILYFITYAAYGFYNLFPQVTAFALMVVFTVFTVVAALNYNSQVIAHIGLVGAYAVPFLLSDGSGKVAVLFSYMAIINAGILAIAFKKYWKSLYYSSFILTWLIYFAWYIMQYRATEHFGIACVFLVIFFLIFYLVFLGYKLIQKEKFVLRDIVLLLANAFVFYGIGYAILQENSTWSKQLGLFTLANAVVHFTVSTIIYLQKLADRNLFFLVSGLALVFITIAIPVQLDGSWVTLLWAGEALLLFWIGTARAVPIYEQISYPLLLLAFASLLQDWQLGYNNLYGGARQPVIAPVLNHLFLGSVLFITAVALIQFLSMRRTDAAATNKYKWIADFFSVVIPAILLFTLYYSIRLEVVNYWNQRYFNQVYNKTIHPGIPGAGESELLNYKTVWIINYTLLFLFLLSVANLKYIKNTWLAYVNLGLNSIAIMLVLSQGLTALGELQANNLLQQQAVFHSSLFNLGLRYTCFVLVVLLLTVCYKYTRQEIIKVPLRMAFDLLLHITVLWMASSELIYWMDQAGSGESHKLGLSILWGCYSLLLIALGIWKNRKHLRIGAIILFGITLLKLFFYDIADLGTIAKTIVFVSLGILLLIISFLYNKYKHIITDEAEK